jgi:hypothetical protein
MRAWFDAGYFDPSVLIAPSFNGELPQDFETIDATFEPPLQVTCFGCGTPDYHHGGPSEVEAADENVWATTVCVHLVQLCLDRNLKAKRILDGARNRWVNRLYG